jgi:hypothetical protein
MRTVMFLRGAAILAAVQGLAHGALFISAKPRHGDAEVALVTAMKANRFFMGGLGYWDYYFGYGLVAASACLVEAALLWQIATMAATQPVLVRPMVVVFVLANLGHALLLARYFKFPLPIAFDLIIATVLVFALVAAASVSTAGGLSTVLRR